MTKKTSPVDVLRNTAEKIVDLDNIESTAKKIWLAGLGAYGSSYDQIEKISKQGKQRYDALSADSAEKFAELVARGTIIQNEAEKKIQQRKEELESRIENLKNISELPFGKELSTAFNDVYNKIDTLRKDFSNSQTESKTQEAAGKTRASKVPTKKTATKKTSVKKTTVEKTGAAKKTTAKKAPVKKTVAKSETSSATKAAVKPAKKAEAVMSDNS